MVNSKTNILLIMTDQQRFDSLSCYGLKAIETPNVDRLAAEGARYLNCYVNNPICTPSRASIFTGQPITGHGVYRLHDIFPPDGVLFSKRLQERGYTTALFGKLHVSGRIYELDNRHPNDGFDIYEESKAPYNLSGSLNGYARWLKKTNSAFYREMKEKGRKIGNVPPHVHLSHWVAENTVRFIESQPPNKPFFCYMSFFDPHDPYSDFPIEMAERVDENLIPRPTVIDGETDNKPEAIQKEHEHGYLGNFHNYSENDIRRMRFGYYASIAFVDQQLGRVLDTLKNKGILDETLIIFMSDHGDMLGDHELLAKGAFFYDPCTKVPLIIRFPTQVDQNTTVHHLVQPHDVAATILGTAGFSKEELTEIMPDSLDLISLVENRGQTLRDHAVCLYRNSSICDQKIYWDPPINASMIRDDRYKLNIYHDSGRGAAKIEGELFDMLDDPLEQNNLWDNSNYGDVKNRLIARVFDWIVDTDVRYNGSRGGEAFPPRTQWSLNNPL
jgi:arylsulfatase A-like enzyme